MKERRRTGVAIAAFGLAVMFTSAVGVVLLIVTGLLNLIFEWWSGIPFAIIVIAGIVGMIIPVLQEANKSGDMRLT